MAALTATQKRIESVCEVKRVSRPIEAPRRLPVWKAALPSVMAEMTRIAVMMRAAGLSKCARSASPRPFFVSIPPTLLLTLSPDMTTA